MAEQMTLAQYEAQVDAKYARMRERQQSDLHAQTRKDHWLLVDPTGEVDGVMTRRRAGSPTQAFELFFTSKKERHKASAEGWHIEVDDVDGTRWAAACERISETDEKETDR
ncbi:hypothetical protein [Rhodococcus daqingensis]|uniref:Uncharacterized protein n=1 Tax=Rhodococcus daqingensis TaxID=2479363 RepID=A0ABW2S333_9NOCA